MRTRQAFKNTLSSLLLELVVAISGFIVPRFFTQVYGSPVNGLVSSINQFITYMSLVEAGIGAAGMVSLYLPLAKKDNAEISGIVSAAKSFYFKSGLIFAALVAALAAVYPHIVQSEIQDVSFIRMMILVLSVSGLTDYFFLGKYRVLLQADQRSYVISLAQICGTVLMTVVSIVLIRMEASALLVKGVTAVIYVLRSAAVAIYVHRQYPNVSFRAKPKMEAFSQRWSALLHQIVTMVVNNTDIILLTLMLPSGALSEVSVYSVYNLVAYALSSLLNSICTGVRSSFGQIISCGEKEALFRNYGTFEYMMTTLTFLVYACMAVLLYPFVGLYSAEFTDGVLYTRWPVAILFTTAGLVQSMRLPGAMLTVAAGHYKQTQVRAIVEAVINLGVSLALVRPMGIVGVLLGTCASYLYRSTDVILYTAKYLLPGTLKITLRRLGRNSLLLTAVAVLGVRVVPMRMNGWIQWFGWAIAVGLASALVFIGANLLLEPDQRKLCVQRAKTFLRNRGKGGKA